MAGGGVDPGYLTGRRAADADPTTRAVALLDWPGASGVTAHRPLQQRTRRSCASRRRRAGGGAERGVRARRPRVGLAQYPRRSERCPRAQTSGPWRQSWRMGRPRILTKSAVGSSGTGACSGRWDAENSTLLPVAVWATRRSDLGAFETATRAIRCVIQPPGLGGRPSRGHLVNATANASWTASSARSMSPKTRIRVATERPEFSRKIWPTAAASTAAKRQPRDSFGKVSRLIREIGERPHLDR